MKVDTNYYIIEFQSYSSRLHSVFIPNKITQNERLTLNVFCIFTPFYVDNKSMAQNEYGQLLTEIFHSSLHITNIKM